MNQVKTVATYARVSTAGQEQEQTVENQAMVMQEYAQKHSLRIVESYVDDGWTSEFLARPALDKLRQDAKSKPWDAVLMYDADRLSRKYAYQSLVMDELNELGIEVLCVTISPPKNPEERILFGVRGLFAEYEREKIKERFRLGKLRKVKAGHILVSDPAYGYTKIPRTEIAPARYEINETEAEVVRIIFDCIVEKHMTLRGIVRHLHVNNIKPRKSKRGVWNTSTLSHLIRNPVYIGTAKWQSAIAVAPLKPLKDGEYKRIKRTSRRARPKEDWLYIPVPAIIDKKHFDRAQAILKENYLLAKRNKKNEYLLSGKIYCVCGRTRTGEGVLNGKHLYYRCSDRVLCSPLPPNCREKSVLARDADAAVWSYIYTAMTSPKLLMEHLERQRAKQSQTMVDLPVTENIEKELAQLARKEEKLNQAYFGGVFDLETFKSYKADISSQREELNQKKVEHARIPTTPRLPSGDDILIFTRFAREQMANLSFDIKKAIVLRTVKRVVAVKSNLLLIGHIVIDYDEMHTNYRNSQGATRHMGGTIPFEINLTMPGNI